MIAVIHPDIIKSEAVKAVSEFINNKIPLSTSIASYSTENELNMDQMKRLIEATNQLAYLKLQTMSEDRTFEFPLAVYQDILARMVSPIEDNGVVIEESIPESPMAIVIPSAELNKQASFDEAPTYNMADVSDSSKINILGKEALKGLDSLNKIANECDILVNNISEVANAVKQDPHYIEKIACIAGDIADDVLAIFNLTGHEKLASGMVFSGPSLENTTELVNLVKSAHIMLDRKYELITLLEKTAKVLDSSMEKEAFLGSFIRKGLSKVMSTAKDNKVTRNLVARAKKTYKNIVPRDTRKKIKGVTDKIPKTVSTPAAIGAAATGLAVGRASKDHTKEAFVAPILGALTGLASKAGAKVIRGSGKGGYKVGKKVLGSTALSAGAMGSLEHTKKGLPI